MHAGAKIAIEKWLKDNQDYLNTVNIADVGSYDVNGSTKELIPESTGFDILEGNGVDVVIKPGIIPKKYKDQFGAVVTTSAFQCCPDSIKFKKQITDLLQSKGLLLLTMCPDSCKPGHSTSPNEYDFRDSIRMTEDELISFFSDSFENIILSRQDEDHPTLVLKATKK